MIYEQAGDGFSSRVSSSSAVAAAAVLRKMRGGSQSVLLRASDGALYVVKMMGNPQGPNVLANEALGNELASYLGLPVPLWRPICLSDNFLDRNKLCWFESATGPIRPPAGLHFASLALGQDSSPMTDEVVPGQWFSRVGNRADFVAMLVVDLWANHTDNRQAIFLQSTDTGSTTAVFIDNGHLFGGPYGQEQQRRGAALSLDRRVYGDPSLKKTLRRWLRRVRSIDDGVLLGLTRCIPREWMSEVYLSQVLSQLRTRQIALSHLLEEEMPFIARMGVGAFPVRDKKNAFNDRSTGQFPNFGRARGELWRN